MMKALVTGGSSGIGLEFARQLAQKGYALALVSNREQELADAAVKLQAEYGVYVETLCIDLAKPGAAANLGKRTIRKSQANPNGGLTERAVSVHVSNVNKKSQE